LTPSEEAKAIATRKEIYERLYPETKRGAGGGRAKAAKASGANGQLGRQQKAQDAFVTDTAKKSGQSERKVRRDATRGKRVKVLDQIVGTCLDKGEELDALAKLPAEEQERLAQAAQRGERVTARPPSVRWPDPPLAAITPAIALANLARSKEPDARPDGLITEETGRKRRVWNVLTDLRNLEQVRPGDIPAIVEHLLHFEADTEMPIEPAEREKTIREIMDTLDGLAELRTKLKAALDEREQTADAEAKPNHLKLVKPHAAR
jgi:hypothetical protein